MSIETIGDRVKARRLAMDMSQEDLAKALGYKSKASISKIENGAGDIPRSKLPKFASILNCSLSYLTGWNELQTFDDEHKVETPYDILCNKIGQLPPSDLNAVSEYVDFMLTKKKER